MSFIGDSRVLEIYDQLDIRKRFQLMYACKGDKGIRICLSLTLQQRHSMHCWLMGIQKDLVNKKPLEIKTSVIMLHHVIHKDEEKMHQRIYMGDQNFLWNHWPQGSFDCKIKVFVNLSYGNSKQFCNEVGVMRCDLEIVELQHAYGATSDSMMRMYCRVSWMITQFLQILHVQWIYWNYVFNDWRMGLFSTLEKEAIQVKIEWEQEHDGVTNDDKLVLKVNMGNIDLMKGKGNTFGYWLSTLPCGHIP